MRQRRPDRHAGIYDLRRLLRTQVLLSRIRIVTLLGSVVCRHKLLDWYFDALARYFDEVARRGPEYDARSDTKAVLYALKAGFYCVGLAFLGIGLLVAAVLSFGHRLKRWFWRLPRG